MANIYLMRTLNLFNATIFSCLLSKFVHTHHRCTNKKLLILVWETVCLRVLVTSIYDNSGDLTHWVNLMAATQVLIFCVLPFTSARFGLLNIIVLSSVHVNKLVSLWLCGSGRRGGGRGRRGLGHWMDALHNADCADPVSNCCSKLVSWLSLK